MSHVEFNHLLETLPALSPEQIETLRRELETVAAQPRSDQEPSVPASDEELQRRLLAAGIISEIKPPRRMDTGTEAFTPITITGEPLSQTVIRDRL